MTSVLEALQQGFSQYARLLCLGWKLANGTYAIRLQAFMAAICFFDFTPESVKLEFTELRLWDVFSCCIDDFVK